jgi:cation-transporting P-type ATPase E
MPVDLAQGLSADEVAARQADGRTNDVPDPTSRSVGAIVRANVFTRFNAILGALLLAIIAVREVKDALFGLVLVLNTLIGIVQEVRAKRTLDRLQVLSAPRVTVRRDGVQTEIDGHQVVQDDVVRLAPGDQVPVDGAVLEAAGLEIDESLLTGESDNVPKRVDDEVLSGSFVAAGSGWFRATAVGRDAYAARLAEEARRFTLVRSDLRDGINDLLRGITFVLVPTAVLLLWSQARSEDSEGTAEVVQGTVSGVVAMVPEGLVLLMSMAMALGVLRLGRRNVLTQELAAIEGLARVDVVCLDKTGTLTENRLSVSDVEPVGPGGAGGDGKGGGGATDELVAVLATMAAADPNPNASLAAIAEHCPAAPGWATSDAVPFSSARKWSAVAIADRGPHLLGAPDLLLDRAESGFDTGPVRARVEAIAREGRRVILLARAPDGADLAAAAEAAVAPPGLVPVALVVLDEQIRADAPDTIRYFQDQGVAVKIISGDSPLTVGEVARRVGVPGATDPVDARTLPDDVDELATVLDERSVFGRVTPSQKRAMVHALQSRGHVVAMTGDGVNDTLALKDADIGVAMGSGSPAARAVARFVVLDDSFAAFPHVVAEGRRVIANVERVANLFVTKTVYATIVALSVGISGVAYPYLPRQFTVINGLTIGAPAFVLALAPNRRRAQPGFLGRVLRFVVPAGVVCGATVVGGYAWARDQARLEEQEVQTLTVLLLFVPAIWVLAILARPYVWWRVLLVVAMPLVLLAGLQLDPVLEYFEAELPEADLVRTALVIGGIAALVLELLWQVGTRLDEQGRFGGGRTLGIGPGRFEDPTTGR